MPTVFTSPKSPVKDVVVQNFMAHWSLQKWACNMSFYGTSTDIAIGYVQLPHAYSIIRQLGGLVVMIRGCCCWRSWVWTLDGEPKNCQNLLLLEETPQPANRMWRKARGCLYSVSYAEASERPWRSLNDQDMCQTPSLIIMSGSVDLFKIEKVSNKWASRPDSHGLDYGEFKYDIYFCLKWRETLPQEASTWNVQNRQKRLVFI